MADEPLRMTFPDVSLAEANQLAGDLQDCLRDVDPDVQVERQRDNPDSQDFGATLGVILAPAVLAALARGIARWLARNSGVKLEIRQADGSVMTLSNLDSRDVPRMIRQMPGADPDPSRTLAILLGAGWYQLAPKLAQGRPFETSGRDVRDYLLSSTGMGLPRENLNWLFDDGRSAADQLKEVGDFLQRRCQELKARGTPASDLIVYYAGHGLFCGPERTYHLAVRATDESREGLTSLRVSDLAQALTDRARFLRRFLVLDCCFSGAAYKEFQSSALQLGREQMLAELPSRGTALLCAASARDAALAPQSLTHTLFTHSLLRSLGKGHPTLGPRLSLNELGDLIREDLRSSFPETWVRPEIHSPDQREGEVAGVALFPNPAHAPREAPPVTISSHPVPPPSPSGKEQTAQQAQALLDQAVRKSSEGDIAGEVEACTAVIDLPGAPAALVAAARVRRAGLRAEQEDAAGAVTDYSATISLPGAPPDLLATALVNRGKLRVLQDNIDAAITDYTAVLQLPGVSPEPLARAHVNRGFAKGRKGDTQGEIADYSAVIKLSGAPSEQVVKALLNRGSTLQEQNDLAAAVEDYTAAARITAVPEQHAKALYYRAGARYKQGDPDGAIADYTTVIGLPGAPTERIAKALVNRGTVHERQRNGAGAIADYTEVIHLPGAPAHQAAKALYSRGRIRMTNRKERGAAISDFIAVIELPGSTQDLVDKATADLQSLLEHGDIADCCQVIDRPDTSTGLVARALYQRACLRAKNRRERGAAITDLTTLLELPNAPPDLITKARADRQQLLASV